MQTEIRYEVWKRSENVYKPTVRMAWNQVVENLNYLYRTIKRRLVFLEVKSQLSQELTFYLMSVSESVCFVDRRITYVLYVKL